MKTTTYACDRCGQTIRSDRAKLIVQAGTAPPSWPVDSASGRPVFDLCAECGAALSEWLAKPEAAPARR